MKNKLLVFEGIDGAGKSTVCRAVAKELQKKGIRAVVFEDLHAAISGFDRIKPFVKKRVRGEASYLFYLASAVHKSEKIEKLLREHWVLCDRYVYSTIAHHQALGVRTGIVAMDDLAIHVPDHAFWLVVEEGRRLRRLKKRGAPAPEELEKKTASNRFGKMEKAFAHLRLARLSNDGSLEETVQTVLKAVLPRRKAG